jgi:hypothetical protein
MASKESMIFKFFEKWKQNKLNKFAINMINSNPQLEKDLRKMDDTYGNLLKNLEKQPDLTK